MSIRLDSFFSVYLFFVANKTSIAGFFVLVAYYMRVTLKFAKLFGTRKIT